MGAEASHRQRWELALTGTCFPRSEFKIAPSTSEVSQSGHSVFLQPSLLLASSLELPEKFWGIKRIISTIWASKPLAKC